MSDAFSLERFTQEFDGGARSYLFEWYIDVTLSQMVLPILDVTPKFLVRAASLPGSDNEEIPTYFKGFEARWPGARRFSDWTVSFNLDNNGNLRRFFEAWMALISEPVALGTYGTPLIYESVQTFSQLGPEYGTIQEGGQLEAQLTYKLIGAWPKSIGPATMDYSSTDITQFDVTFSYLYHVVDVLDIF